MNLQWIVNLGRRDLIFGKSSSAFEPLERSFLFLMFHTFPRFSSFNVDKSFSIFNLSNIYNNVFVKLMVTKIKMLIRSRANYVNRHLDDGYHSNVEEYLRFSYLLIQRSRQAFHMIRLVFTSAADFFS